MLSTLFDGSPQQILILLLRVPSILIALTIHEISHGITAYKLGDPTAHSLGRLSINPLKHLDIIGTICMFLFGFGWAKPVPINTRYFKRPRRDIALTAASGPLSNIGLGIIGILLALIVYNLSPETEFFNVLFLFFLVFYQLNFGLAIFNLIPIPPFDGSRILFVFLPSRLYFGIMKYERFIMIALLFGLWSGVLFFPIQGGIQGLEYVFGKLFSLIPGLGSTWF